MNKQEIETYVKIRDAFAMAAQAIDDLLNTEKPVFQKGASQLAEATGILVKFPPELSNHLNVKDGKIYCEYVSKERWTEINGFAKDLGYEWVSAGKESHWQKKVN
jgi:hypothetical protein